jgi:alkylhydroperoxidase family enzyme
VLAFTDAFVNHPDQIDEQVRTALRAHLEPGQVVELALILGAFLGFSKLRIALGLVPDEMEVRVVPTPAPDPTTNPPTRS